MGKPAVETSPTNLDAPLTLTEPAPKPLGLRDTLGLWGNLGISLLLPVAAAFVILPGSPFGATMGAIVVGAIIGSVLLGLGAAAGARESVPGHGVVTRPPRPQNLIPADGTEHHPMRGLGQPSKL
jgi:hypothetical protein